MSASPQAVSSGTRIVIPRAEAPRVSIIVASAAEPRFLLACLRSLERHLPRSIPSETIVVLDGAPAETCAMLGESVSGARVLASRVQFGLAGAGNRGRRVARSELLGILHDDSEIEDGWLEALVAAADSHPEAGAFGGLIVSPDGSPQTAGVVLFRNGATTPPWAETPPMPGGFGPSRAADFCASNALLVRAGAWDAVGGFDERYFPAYFVDADLAMALREAGWSVLFVPDARSRHRRGSSSRKEFQEWVSGRNRGAFVEKWTAALLDHEPWDARSPASIERALDRARTRALLLAAGPRKTGSSPAETGAPSRWDECRALEQDLALRRAYAQHLECVLDAERTIQSLSWWRIYVHLLPLLRPLRAVLRRLSRPGSSSRKG